MAARIRSGHDDEGFNAMNTSLRAQRSNPEMPATAQRRPDWIATAAAHLAMTAGRAVVYIRTLMPPSTVITWPLT
jgi:hypothetical protein